MPTGSNWISDLNVKGAVGFRRQNLAPARLKGRLMTPWFFTLPEWQAKNLQAIAQAEEVIRGG